VRVRFLADADLNRAIVSGVLRREPSLDFLTAQEAGLRGMNDSEVLALAAEGQRALVSHDAGTMHLCHRIRKAMMEVNPAPIGGKGATVETDETYAGGKKRHAGSGYLGNKTMILGALERGEISQIRLRVEKNKKWGDKKVLHGFVTETTKPDTSKVYTDDNPGYLGIADADTPHKSVNHSAEEWVRGDVHTNEIEGVWSLFKRSIVGSYHQVSAKHLDRYLEEFEWRLNQRENPFLFRDTLTRLVTTEKMEYKQLIST
jgi:hypothetical protein